MSSVLFLQHFARQYELEGVEVPFSLELNTVDSPDKILGQLNPDKHYAIVHRQETEEQTDSCWVISSSEYTLKGVILSKNNYSVPCVHAENQWSLCGLSSIVSMPFWEYTAIDAIERDLQPSVYFFERTQSRIDPNVLTYIEPIRQKLLEKCTNTEIELPAPMVSLQPLIRELLLRRKQNGLKCNPEDLAALGIGRQKASRGPITAPGEVSAEAGCRVRGAKHDEESYLTRPTIMQEWNCDVCSSLQSALDSVCELCGSVRKSALH